MLANRCCSRRPVVGEKPCRAGRRARQEQRYRLDTCTWLLLLPAACAQQCCVDTHSG